MKTFFSAHTDVFIELDQQAMIERVLKKIY